MTKLIIIIVVIFVIVIIVIIIIEERDVGSCCDGSSGRSFMMDSVKYFLFQTVLHDWCYKGRGMCYPFALSGKSSPCSADFLSNYLNGPLPYVRRRIIVLKMC